MKVRFVVDRRQKLPGKHQGVLVWFAELSDFGCNSNSFKKEAGSGPLDVCHERFVGNRRSGLFVN